MDRVSTIWWLGSDGSNLHKLTDTFSKSESGPVFSPDGTEIVFSQLDPQAANSDLWLVDPNGTIIGQLTDTPAVSEYPLAWQPCDARSVRVDAADIRGTALTDPARYPLLAQYLTVAIAIVAVALMPLLPNRSGSGSRPSSSWLGVLLMATRNARRFRAPRRRRQMDVDE